MNEQRKARRRDLMQSDRPGGTARTQVLDQRSSTSHAGDGGAGRHKAPDSPSAINAARRDVLPYRSNPVVASVNCFIPPCAPIHPAKYYSTIIAVGFCGASPPRLVRIGVTSGRATVVEGSAPLAPNPINA
jgi:hypothetical protein